MVIVIQCKDKIGLVALISGVLAQHGINILSMREFVDTTASVFFARIVVDSHEDASDLQGALKTVLPEDASIKVNPNPIKKVILLVTKEYHCLSDILIRNHFKTLGASVEAVIGNHPDLENICQRFEVPFHFISHEGKEKYLFENEIKQQIHQYHFDYLILAKFMRILSPDFIADFPERIINIHHSFLPAFIGASPYRQAFNRGVKLIGATAHFVTNQLDEGPIIAQQTIPVNHTFSVADMVKAGKEIEKAVLIKAIQLVFDDRVFVLDNKTVVFD
ncbi:formyltetrahydrofolate deformylase [Pedobacter puniceum]|uniref:Formyltetrahydrofolate deformylase n=1 Tax=Pedobacter puniceum TaxID=2666136 RepID=A0A7K0FMT3_9SPHI|nr:formyltetrahydrofolate deformylase [Pedobacter puniceum]MRX46971.1 formyltetrahydrofolate deformylase [Pedobacter puniceum]